MREYGITDDQAFEVGLACGGTVGILVAKLDLSLLPALDEAVGADRPAALTMAATGPRLGEQQLHDGAEGPVARLLSNGESALADVDGEAVFVHALAPRPAMIVFGAIDHAAALARVGKLLGYRVTVCDARSAFVTPERFPEADELVVEWPDSFLERTQVDERTVICVLTHDEKFDVPALIARARDAGRLHRRDGQQGDDRRPRGAPARRGCRRRRHRPDPRPDRPGDRRPLARGGRGRDRRARSWRRPPSPAAARRTRAVP